MRALTPVLLFAVLLAAGGAALYYAPVILQKWYTLLNRPSTPRDPALRACDADRDDVLGRLGEAYAVGLLSKAEYEYRSNAAMHATTLGVLEGLTQDLPDDR